MNTLPRQILSALLAGVIVPGFLFGSIPVKNSPPPAEDPIVSAPTESYPAQTQIMIPVLESDGSVTDMELEAYVCGVVLGEMPASFETEALKAQAVAARTYALRCVADGVHKKNAVCKEHTCCQNYCDPAGYILSGGKQSNLDKIVAAVEQTRSQVAVYNGKLIFASYFASSGGQTEDAVAVWGRSIPYLVSVESPDETDKPYQNSKLVLSAKDFQKKLGVTLSGTPKSWFGKVTYTDGGGVETICIGGKNYTGVKLRSLLGLRSTRFRVTTSDTAVTFTTNGYGHRVGMSQYGAEAMAVAGKCYDEILCHYYPGTVLENYPIDKGENLG